MITRLTVSKLRDLIRTAHIHQDDSVMITKAEVDGLIAELKALRKRLEPLPPEKQIQRNPELALDHAEVEINLVPAINELFRWMKHPERARGKNWYVPRNHPCGMGGLAIHIPKDFPLPNATA